MRSLHLMASRFSIVILAEARASRADVTTWQREFPMHSLILSEGSPIGSGGILMLISRTAFQTPGANDIVELVKGRVLLVKLAIGLCPVTVAGIHLDPSHTVAQRTRVLKLIEANVPPPTVTPMIIGGDFNTIVDGDARFHPTTAEYNHNNDPLHATFNQILNHRLLEIHQDSYTRVGRLNGVPHVLSRLDRWYMNVDPVFAQDCRCTAGLYLPLLTNGMSDHAPIFIKITAMRGAPPSPSEPLRSAMGG